MKGLIKIVLSQCKLHAKGMPLWLFKDFDGDRDKKNKRTKRSNKNLRLNLEREAKQLY